MFFFSLSFFSSAASRRFMMHACNGDGIPPLPPNIALSSFDPGFLMDHNLIDPNDR
jgi:hypothetical protein